jgi:hypothetical protein
MKGFQLSDCNHEQREKTNANTLCMTKVAQRLDRRQIWSRYVIT